MVLSNSKQRFSFSRISVCLLYTSAYNHIKEMVITHTGLELGATIYLDYTLSSKPSFLSTPDIDEVLQELSPVKE